VAVEPFFEKNKVLTVRWRFVPHSLSLESYDKFWQKYGGGKDNRRKQIIHKAEAKSTNDFRCLSIFEGAAGAQKSYAAILTDYQIVL
jgi:hypothetical protein